MSNVEQADRLARVRAAIATLYESHFERVARYIAVRTGDSTEAEDLASEVFVRALRSADSYEEKGAPMEAWVFRIAHNIVVDQLRKRDRRPASVPLDEAFSVAGPDDPAREVVRMHEAEEVRAAMASLTDAQRQVVSLRFGGEMTSEEVARVVGKNPGAVRELQSAALKKLRTVLKSSV